MLPGEGEIVGFATGDDVVGVIEGDDVVGVIDGDEIDGDDDGAQQNQTSQSIPTPSFENPF